MIAAEAAELLRGQVAAGDLDLDRDEALLALRLRRWRRRSASNSLRSPFGRAVALPGRPGAFGLLVVDEEQVVDREVALVDPVALELLVDQLAEGVDADLVDQHLDPGAGAVHAQPLLAVEDPQDGLGDLQVVAVVELDELVEGRGDRGA